MNCSTCGDSLSPDVRFCPRCGTKAVWEGQAGGARAAGCASAEGYVPAQGYIPAQGCTPYDRVSRHLQILSVLWLIYAGLRLISGSLGVLALRGLFAGRFHNAPLELGWSPFGSLLLANLWPMALAAVLLSASGGLLTGYALLTRQSWGRVLAIVIGVMVLIHPPLGTALGIYTLWVLGPRLSGDEYAALADAEG